MPSKWKYDQQIASDPDLCAHMAMEEAIQNAIRHGNKCGPGTFVHVTIDLDGVRFESTVTDEGQGFDPEAVPNPTEDANLDKCSGRGVMLIKHFVDEVTYNACGNSVTLRKTKKTA